MLTNGRRAIVVGFSGVGAIVFSGLNYVAYSELVGSISKYTGGVFSTTNRTIRGATITQTKAATINI
jgi:hypothetical protein